MPFEIEICKQGFYWITYSGTVDLEQRLQALQAVEAYSRKKPIKGNIIDFRNAELVCSFTEQLEFASKATELSGHRGRKAAYLIKGQCTPPTKILELAMCNRGIETRLFIDESEAITWLTDACYRSYADFKNNDYCLLGNGDRMEACKTGAVEERFYQKP